MPILKYHNIIDTWKWYLLWHNKYHFPVEQRPTRRFFKAPEKNQLGLRPRSIVGGNRGGSESPPLLIETRDWGENSVFKTPYKMIRGRKYNYGLHRINWGPVQNVFSIICLQISLRLLNRYNTALSFTQTTPPTSDLVISNTIQNLLKQNFDPHFSTDAVKWFYKREKKPFV